MLHSKSYLGLPNEIWNSLLSEVEDMLRDEEIGTHILGVYPSGSRIYGIESESPQFICIYIDTAELFLNPYYMRNRETGFTERTIKIDNSSVVFIELYSWIQWMIFKDIFISNDRFLNMYDLIPCNHDIAYQDQSIDDLIDIVREFTYQGMYLGIKNRLEKSYNYNLRYALYIRTIYNLLNTGKFMPNINHDMGYVEMIKGEDLKDDTIDTDILLGQHVRENRQYGRAGLSQYIKDLRENTIQLLFKIERHGLQEKLAKDMGKEVVRIYKFIL